jgi:hypothetical protein
MLRNKKMNNNRTLVISWLEAKAIVITQQNRAIVSLIFELKTTAIRSVILEKAGISCIVQFKLKEEMKRLGFESILRFSN